MVSETYKVLIQKQNKEVEEEKSKDDEEKSKVKETE